MKYIDVDLLIRKIKYQIRLENLNFAALGGGGQTFCINTLEWVLKQIDSLQQEQPEVDLEKEIDSYFKMWWMDLTDQGYILRTPDGTAGLISVKNIARHFAEWGAEHAKIDVTDFCKPIDPGIAQCIADHSWEMLGEDEKSVPSGLEEAAEKYRKESYSKSILPNIDGPMPEYGGSIKDAFKSGAEWQKEQMDVSDCSELEDEAKNYFQGLWPDTTTAEGCNATMSFTAPAILRLIKHFTYWQYQKDRAEFAKLKAREWINGYNEGLLAIGKEDKK